MSVYARTLMKKPTLSRMAVWLVIPPLRVAALGMLSAILMVPASADSVLTEPIGFNKITCPPNSDTIVGLPLRTQGSRTTSLTATPVVNGDLATLEVSIASFEAGDFAKRYVKFTSGSKNGHWYHVDETASASAGKLVIDLNGDTLAGVGSGDGLLIAEYWTLDSLFPPALATTNPGTTGHAIVASTSRFASGRMTEILLPNKLATGTNIAPNQTFYLLNGGWRKQGESHTLNFGDTELHPDSYLIIRHPSTVTVATVYRCLGEVELGALTIPLSTDPAVYRDNFVAIPRPMPIPLDDLNLVPDAFVESTNRFASGRKDELLLFDNQVGAFNKAPSVTYYYFNGAWRKQGQPHTEDFGADVIPAGHGFLIRKAPAVSTAFWTNPASYGANPQP